MTYIQMEQRTIYGILKTKYLDHVETSWIYPTIKIFLIGVAVILGGLIWSFPETVWGWVGDFFWAWNYLFPKILILLFVFFAVPVVFRDLKEWVSEIQKKDDWAKIWGVSVVEIVWYIFEHNNFPRDEVIENFAITRSQYSEIVNLLDKNNILIRWESNSRILNPKMTRQIIADILMWKDEKKYGEVIGDKHDFIDGMKDKITSLLSQEKEERWKKKKIAQTASES